MIARRSALSPGISHAHIWQGSHNRDIFNAVMRSPRPAGWQSNVRTGDLDIQPGVTDRDRDLIQGAACGKGGECAWKRNEAFKRQPRGNSEQDFAQQFPPG